METFKDPKDALTRKFVNEAGLEKAPAGTYDTIMQQIQALNAYSITHKPLISRRGWVLIFAFFILFLAGVFWVPIEKFYLNSLPELGNNKLIQQLNTIELSPITLYALGFLGLFLIQLPFLKRLLESEKA